MDGRHRVRGRSAPLVAVAGVLVAALAAWLGYSYGINRHTGPDCTNPLSVTVVAAPEISPVLAHIAGGLTPQQRTNGDTCYLFQVTGQEPAQVAAALTGTGREPLPDVWVSDSTYWLREAAAVNLDLPPQGQSIATSPTVLATSQRVARSLGWPGRRLNWDTVLGTTPDLPLGVTDPGNGPLGLFGLIGVRDAVRGAGRPDTARVAAFRALSKNVAAPDEDLFAALQKSEGTPGAVSAAVTSEQAVVQYSRRQQAVPVVAVYPDHPTPGLDYPYVVLPGASDAVRAAAQRFLGVVLGADPSEMAARGFRKPDGTVGASFPTAGGVDPAPVEPVALPAQSTVDVVLAEWAGVNRSGRLLAVIDISGSMNDVVPGTGKTRMELTKQTAQAGLGLLKPTTEVGLWVFSTNLDGNRDYREILPIRPLYAGGARAYQEIGKIQAKPNGGTGLYDTVLAGYQRLRSGWNPARINVLVVLTDGQNEDPEGISRETLLSRLRALVDPKRPLRLIFIGLGSGVDAADLSQIAAVTGGRAFVTPDPRRISDIFLAALTFMTCVPPDCRQ